MASVVSDSVRPQRWQPTRLPCPWDSPGKNTGVGCHFLLQCRKVKSESEVAQSCPTLSNPMDCSLPGSSVHGIFQARVLELGAIAFSEMSSLGPSNSSPQYAFNKSACIPQKPLASMPLAILFIVAPNKTPQCPLTMKAQNPRAVQFSSVQSLSRV